MKMRDFDDFDWEGWAGAERWEDGPPLIADHGATLDGEEAWLIADRNGISVFVLDGEDFDLRLDHGRGLTRLICEALPREMTRKGLEALGFR